LEATAVAAKVEQMGAAKVAVEERGWHWRRLRPSS